MNVHTHLAGRRRDARRALGLSRRHGAARATPAVVTGDRLTVGVVTPHAAAGPEVELPAMTRGRVATVVSRTGSPPEAAQTPPRTAPPAQTQLRAATELDRAAVTFGGRTLAAVALASTTSGYVIGHREGGRPHRTTVTALRGPCRGQLRGSRGGAAHARGLAGPAGAPAMVRRRVRQARRGVLPQPGVRRRGDQRGGSPR